MADRISQLPVQVVTLPTDAKARISQEPVQVVTLPTDAKARISQVAVQVVVAIPPSPNRTATDTTSVSDAATRAAIVHARTASDTTATSDALSVRSTRTASDTTSVSESVARIFGVVRTATDTTSLSDAATRAAISHARTAADTTSVSDVVRTVYTRTATDTTSTSETLARIFRPVRTATDSVSGLTDAATRAAIVHARTATDTTTVTEDVSKSKRRATDTVTTSDSIARLRIVPRHLIELSTVSDAVTHPAHVFTVTATDTTSVSETASKSARAARDTVAVSDSITRHVVANRPIADTVRTPIEFANAFSGALHPGGATAITDKLADAETITDPPVGETYAEGFALLWNPTRDPTEPVFPYSLFPSPHGEYSGWVKLVLTAPANVVIDTFDSTGMTDTYLALYNSTPTLLYASDDYLANQHWSTIDHAQLVTLAAGTYYIAVYPADGTLSKYTTPDRLVVIRITRSLAATGTFIDPAGRGTPPYVSPPPPPPRPYESPSPAPAVTVIRINGVDVTSRVELADAEFTALVNGGIGQANLRVKDILHNTEFQTGESLTLDIDGVRKWGGTVRIATRQFAFPVQDTTNPGAVTRFWAITGLDYNELFHKRVVLDEAHPTTKTNFPYPVGTYDDTIINDIFSNYLSISGDGLSRAGVQRVGIVTLDIPGVTSGKGTLANGIGNVASAGDYWKETMDVIRRATGAIYYITPNKVFSYTDVDVPSTPWRLTDVPAADLDVPFQSIGILDDGMNLINDMMVWGAGAGSGQIVFARSQDDTSQAVHGVWQEGLYTSGLIHQASANLVASTRVYGTPQSQRGHKDDKVTVSLRTFKPYFSAGDRVKVDVHIFGYSATVPVRSMRVRWISPQHPVFELQLGQDIDDPFSIFESQYRPVNFGGWHIGIPQWPSPGGPDTQVIRGVVIDSFSRVIPDFYAHDGSLRPIGDWGQGEHINWAISAIAQNTHSPVEDGWGVLKNKQAHYVRPGSIEDGDYANNPKSMSGYVDSFQADGTPISIRDLFIKFKIGRLERIIPAALSSSSGTNFYSSYDNLGNLFDYTLDAFGMPIPNPVTGGGKGGGVPFGPSSGTITFDADPGFGPATITGTIVQGDIAGQVGFTANDPGGFTPWTQNGNWAPGKVGSLSFVDNGAGLHFNGGFSIQNIMYTAKDERDASNWFNGVWFQFVGSGASYVVVDRHDGGSGAYGIVTRCDNGGDLNTDGAILLDPDVEYVMRWYRPNRHQSMVKIWAYGAAEPPDWLATSTETGFPLTPQEPSTQRLEVKSGHFPWQQWSLGIDIIASGTVDGSPILGQPTGGNTGNGGSTSGSYPSYFDGTTYQMVWAFFSGSSRIWIDGRRQRLGIDYVEYPALGRIVFTSPVPPTRQIIAYVTANGLVEP